MIKKLLFLLLFAFFSTGCAERGITFKPVASNQKTFTPTPKITVTKADDDFLSEPTKNTLSGTLILIIGLIILL